jgi:hypothetical protein
LARWRVPYLRIRYEDLVAEPLSTLRRVGRFAWDTPVVDPGELAEGRVTFATDHTVDGNPIRFQTGSVELRLDDQWRVAMAPATRRTVTVFTAPLLANYGYALRGTGR